MDLDGAIILLEEDDRPRAAGLSFPGTGNALFDNPSTKIGADHALVREAGGRPQIGIRNASLPGEAGKRFGLVNRQRLRSGLDHSRSVALSDRLLGLIVYASNSIPRPETDRDRLD